MAKESKKDEISRSQRETVLSELIKTMSTTGLNWTQDWFSVGMPYNFSTGRQYRGANALYLGHLSLAYGDPRWITPEGAFKASRERNEHWSWKGQKCEYAEFWKQYPVYEKDEKGEVVLDDFGNKKIAYVLTKLAAVYPLLNLAQIKGAPKYHGENRLLAGDFSAADSIITQYYGAAKSGCKFKEEGDRAYYSPSLDQVKIPPRGLFSSVEGFTSTLAHETVHSTGAECRLNRLPNDVFFGTEPYAREELVAEIGSVLLCADLGFSYSHTEASLKNHAAYLANWQLALQQDDALTQFFKAVSDAQKAVDYVLKYVQPEEETSNAVPEEIA